MGGNDTLIGFSDDTLDGGADDDLLQADGNSVVMLGGDGDDTLVGADSFSYDGPSRMTGGNGRDTFRLMQNLYTQAIIEDFTASDRLDVDNLVRSTVFYPGGNPFDPVHGVLKLVQEGNDTLLMWTQQANRPDSVLVAARLVNVQASSLTAANFVPELPPDGSPLPPQVIEGGSGDDVLDGGYLSSILSGHGGNDEIVGSTQNDSLMGGAGNDTLDGGNGDDLLDGGSGDDSLVAWSGGDTLLGGQGNDIIRIHGLGSTSEVVVDGGDGNDRIDVSSDTGPVRIQGGEGRDVVSPDGVSDHAVTITDFTPGANGDTLDLTPLLDSLMWGRGTRDFNPFAGNGVLALMEQGSDTLLQFRASDQSSYRTIVVLSNVALAQLTASNFGGIPPDGSAVPVLEQRGTAGNDVLKGTVFDDRIFGGDGNDRLDGIAGHDTLFGEGGDDYLERAGTQFGNEGNDNLTGADGATLLSGGLGDDNLICITGGADTLLGGEGDDRLEIFRAPFRPNPHGPLPFAQGDVWAQGGVGNDRFYLFGGDADSHVELSGGDGSDLYTFSSVAGEQTVITDFSDTDVLDVSTIVESYFPNGFPGSNPFSTDAGVLRLVQRDGDTLVQADRDGAAGSEFDWQTVVVLRNVDAGSLTASNFTDGYKPDGTPVDGVIRVADPAGGTLEGTASADTLSGGAGDDVLQGYGGNDQIDGGVGRDTLLGGGGDDVLVVRNSVAEAFTYVYGDYSGGTGNDLIRVELNAAEAPTGWRTVEADGGYGRDVFELVSASAQATVRIVDFTAGDEVTAGNDADQLALGYVLDELAAAGLYHGGNPLTSGALRLVQSDADLFVQALLPDGGYRTIIELLRVAAEDLTPHNFAGGFAPGVETIAGDIVEGSDDADELVGYYFEDTINGADGADRLIGLGGNDALTGAAVRIHSSWPAPTVPIRSPTSKPAATGSRWTLR
ncbi:hypothetical protein C9I28_19875 [Pseudoduganella armeniaca]|uniref:Calcium-binding protein n=1 Tax=Pseudoduganella armeniaca TaxID=2072590 RepID=A0A2R4CDE8_9BURK|nr:hypothetical protein C9I28_19875 [Pseudoduganella armeniaca]